MGRKSLNKTYEQILAEGRERSRKYYALHSKEINKKVMARYNRIKNASLNKNNT